MRDQVVLLHLLGPRRPLQLRLPLLPLAISACDDEAGQGRVLHGPDADVDSEGVGEAVGAI